MIDDKTIDEYLHMSFLKNLN